MSKLPRQLAHLDGHCRLQPEHLGRRKNSFVGFLVPHSPRAGSSEHSEHHHAAVVPRVSRQIGSEQFRRVPQQIGSGTAPVETVGHDAEAGLGQRDDDIIPVASSAGLAQRADRPTCQPAATALQPDRSTSMLEAGRCELLADRERRDGRRQAVLPGSGGDGHEDEPRSEQCTSTVSALEYCAEVEPGREESRGSLPSGVPHRPARRQKAAAKLGALDAERGSEQQPDSSICGGGGSSSTRHADVHAALEPQAAGSRSLKLAPSPSPVGQHAHPYPHACEFLLRACASSGWRVGV